MLIEYVVKQYGLDKLPALVRDPNHIEQVLGQDEQKLHAGWVAHIAKNEK